jgi:hypothetical protein
MRQSEDPRDQMRENITEEIESLKGSQCDVLDQCCHWDIGAIPIPGVGAKPIPGAFDSPSARKLRTFEVWDGDEVLGLVEGTGFNAAEKGSDRTSSSLLPP